MNISSRSLLLVAMVATISAACVWDRITTVMEDAPFPSDLQLITGEFPRQGEAFLRWKASDRLRKIGGAVISDLDDWDDLASSLDKLGLKDSALAVMLRKREEFGERYQTMANLGTYFFHTGRLQEGLPRIDSALQINPEAHFGRERYQRHLVAYFLARRKAIPMESSKWMKGQERGYAAFVAKELGVRRLSPAERAKAIQGVLGMMRFGDYRSPVLLEAWADLNAKSGTPESRRSAALGYLQASRRTEGASRATYLSLATQVIGEKSLPAIESTLVAGEKRAEELVKKIAAFEAKVLLSTDEEDPDDRWTNEFLKVKVTKRELNF